MVKLNGRKGLLYKARGQLIKRLSGAEQVSTMDVVAEEEETAEEHNVTDRGSAVIFPVLPGDVVGQLSRSREFEPDQAGIPVLARRTRRPNSRYLHAESVDRYLLPRRAITKK